MVKESNNEIQETKTESQENQTDNGSKKTKSKTTKMFKGDIKADVHPDNVATWQEEGWRIEGE